MAVLVHSVDPLYWISRPAGMMRMVVTSIVASRVGLKLIRVDRSFPGWISVMITMVFPLRTVAIVRLIICCRSFLATIFGSFAAVGVPAWSAIMPPVAHGPVLLDCRSDSVFAVQCSWVPGGVVPEGYDGGVVRYAPG